MKAKNTRYERYLKEVAQLHGPPPINPFHALRTEGKYVYTSVNPSISEVTLTTDQSFTLIGLANRIGISKQALIRTEQGCFPDIPERILNYWVDEVGLDYLTLTSGYVRFIRLTRERHTRLFGSVLPTFYADRNDRRHPLLRLRECWTAPVTNTRLGEMNVTELAKLLCLNQSVLSYFENHVKQQASVPSPLLQALRDAGYQNDDLTGFEEAYVAHRLELIGGQLYTPIHSNTPVGNDTPSFTDRVMEALHHG